MKKHVFGFALFSLIVASFVFAYAFFSAPSMPSKEAVKPPVSQVETRVEKPYFCRYKSNKISFEVLSSEFIAEENKLVSRVKVNWKGYSEAPQRIYLTSLFTAVQNNKKNTFGTVEILDNPFKEADQKIVTVFTRVSGKTKVSEKDNLYVSFSLKENLTNEETGNDNYLSEPQSVLFVHSR